MSVKFAMLGEHCEIMSGFAWSASKFNQDGRGVPIVRIQNVDTAEEKNFVFWDEYYDERFMIRRGDLLLTLSGSFRIESWNGPDALLNQRIVKLIPSSDIDKRWLLHVLRPRLGQIERLGKRALVNNVSLADIRNLKIPLPPLPEQRRIAEVLDRAEALRAKRRAALAQLDTLTQAIFLDMFGDPATNPKGMRKLPLGELIKLKSGGFLPATNMVQLGKFPVLGGNGVSGHHDQYMFETPQIVIGRVGVYCGCVHVSPPRSWVTDNALYVSERKEDVEFDYLVHALRHARLNRYASQSGQPLVSGSRIYPVEILVPRLNLQNEFARRVAAVEKLKTAHRASLAELDALFTALQHRAFRGEL